MVRRLSLLALSVLLPVSSLAAQDVDAIFERYNAAIDPGNRASAIQGMKLTGEFEMAAAGIKATMEVFQRRPRQVLTVIQIPGLGEMRQGSDGTTTWSSDPMGGPRILTGLEAAPIADGADFDAIRRTRSNFASVEAAGESEVEGEKCVRVQLTWKSGRKTTECFSVTSGLVIESSGTQQTPQGEIQTSTRISDYRDVGGVKMPHLMVTSMMGIQQVIRVTAIEHGEQDASRFELPAAIKALRAP